MNELGNVTLTVEFEIHATSVREAEKLLDVWLRPAEYDDALKRYEVVKTEWKSPTAAAITTYEKR